jgi:nucleoside-diphosphate-sugar epimerase
VEKAAKLLGFEAEVSLKQGLQELIRWRNSVKPSPVEVEAL